MDNNNFTADIDGVRYTFDELKQFAIGTDAVMLGKVAYVNNLMLQRIVATNSRASTETLLWLSKAGTKVATGLIRNRNTPLAAWFELAMNDSVEVRRSVAGSKRTPFVVLQHIAEVETQQTVLNKLLDNDRTDYTIIRLCATSDDANKKWMVSRSHKLEEELLFSLVQDRRFLRNIVDDDRIPTYLLERILHTVKNAETREDKIVQQMVVNALSIKPEYVSWPEEWIETSLGSKLYDWVSQTRKRIQKEQS